MLHLHHVESTTHLKETVKRTCEIYAVLENQVVLVALY